MLYLERFNYVIKHLPGAKNVLADALSRRPDLVPEEQDNTDAIAIPPTNFINFIDKELYKNIRSNKNKIDQPEKFEEWMKDIYLYQDRVVIPDDENIKRQLLQNAHDHVTSGHPGIQETIRRV
jgi:hypothetical protein